MDESLPNLRGHLAGLLEGVIAPDQFHRWAWDNAAAIEAYGSDEDVALLNLALNRFAEYTSGYIDAENLLDALTNPLVQHALQPRRTVVA